MATISFKQTRNIVGDIDPDAIFYRDMTGQIWWVPNTHRYWHEVYEPWLAAGNTPLGPDDPWPDP